MMPSQKPRIALTVDDDMNELLTEIATLQGIPKSTLIVQYLDALRPHIVEIREALRLVQQQKDERHTYVKCSSMVSKTSLTY